MKNFIGLPTKLIEFGFENIMEMELKDQILKLKIESREFTADVELHLTKNKVKGKKNHLFKFFKKEKLDTSDLF